MIIGTNGYVTIRDGNEIVFGPRDTFDSKGFFINPPKIYHEKIDFDKEYEKSLKKSIQYFLECVKNKNSLNENDFRKSVLSTKLLINIKANH